MKQDSQNLLEALQYFQAGRPAEAEAICRRLVLADGADAEALHFLAVIVMQNGRHEEAVSLIERAIAAGPPIAAYYANLGVALRRLGRMDEALAAYDSAVRLAPDYAEAHYNRANLLGDLRRVDEAAAAYRSAICLSPAIGKAYLNLGWLRQRAGRPDESFALAKWAFSLEESADAKMLFVDALERVGFHVAEDRVIRLTIRALAEGWGCGRRLTLTVVRMVRLNKAMADLLDHPAFGDDWSVEKCAAGLAVLAGNPLLLQLMRVAQIADLSVERLLRSCRSLLLRQAMTGSFAFPASGQFLDLFCALAMQCFINDYVYYCTDEELALVDRLRSAVLDGLQGKAEVSIGQLMILAAYVPLHSLPDSQKLASASVPEPLRSVLQQQIAEPMMERQLRAEIAPLTAMKDDVSQAVRQQYEESPYPRWTKARLVKPQATLADYVRGFVRSPAGQLPDTATPKVLVAGCGTGRHPIETMQGLPGAEVLAVDLSLASLAYASRKVREIGLPALKFAQADLLELGNCGRQFDLIESVGVLHHLADPERGLQVLTSILRPGGLLRLGLYSEYGRKQVVAARDYIAERNYRADIQGIRRLRHDLQELEDTDPLKAITLSSDFSSASDCRDLLFHVQEHRLTIPVIETWLRRHNLRFVGFQVEAEIYQRFTEAFPEPGSDLDLAVWDRFEQDNPLTFASMYMLWAQKD